MTSIGKAIFTVAVLFWALDPALGQDPVAPVGTTVVDIQSPERWIRQLGHETMAKREEAERVLERIPKLWGR